MHAQAVPVLTRVAVSSLEASAPLTERHAPRRQGAGGGERCDKEQDPGDPGDTGLPVHLVEAPVNRWMAGQRTA